MNERLKATRESSNAGWQRAVELGAEVARLNAQIAVADEIIQHLIVGDGGDLSHLCVFLVDAIGRYEAFDKPFPEQPS